MNETNHAYKMDEMRIHNTYYLQLHKYKSGVGIILYKWHIILVDSAIDFSFCTC